MSCSVTARLLLSRCSTPDTKLAARCSYRGFAEPSLRMHCCCEEMSIHEFVNGSQEVCTFWGLTLAMQGYISQVEVLVQGVAHACRKVFPLQEPMEDS